MRIGNQFIGCLWLCHLVWLFAGCSGTDPEPTPTPTPDPNGTENCEMDDSKQGGTESDWMLTVGEVTEPQYVCPKADVDHFWFQLDDPRSIVTIELKNNVNMTEVDYCFDLFFETHEQQVGSACDFDGSDGVTQLKATFYLEEAGTYFLEVRDASLDDFDTRNPYLVSMLTQVDPDSNEPNDTFDVATPLTPEQPMAGNISYLKDQDWYVLSGLSAGQVVEVELTTAEGSPVDLHYALFLADGQTPVNEGEDNNGQDGPTDLKDALPAKQNGTYYLRITDVQDNDSDLSVGYVLKVTIHNDPDTKDQTAPFNNTWENAEALGSDVAVLGRAISYRGDEDWYVIDSTVGVPALLEIDLDYDGNLFDPQVELIYADPDHSCNPGDECDLLEISCAGGCDTVECSNARCPSHECFIQMDQCRGAGVCLPRDSSESVSGCGIGMLIMRGAEWSEVGDPMHLHTVAPMKGERVYLRVSDFQSDNYDLVATYSFKVTVRDEPDPNEPNGLYNPYLTKEQERDTRRWNYSKAKTINCTTTPPTFSSPDDITEITCTVSGYLSYRGDQDWYRLVVPYDEDFLIPKLDEADPEIMGDNVDWDIKFDWDFSGRKPMEIGIGLYTASQDMSFDEEDENKQSGQWGTGSQECSYFCGEYHTPASEGYLWMFTPDFVGYDYDTPYSITITATRDCPANCGYCSAGCSAWCCPNVNNPSP